MTWCCGSPPRLLGNALAVLHRSGACEMHTCALRSGVNYDGQSTATPCQAMCADTREVDRPPEALEPGQADL